MSSLEKLLKSGALIQEGIETKELTWNNGEEDILFTVEVKREMSAADWEAIYIDSSTGKVGQHEEKSLLAAKVSRMVLIDGAPVPRETAEKFRIELLHVLAGAINEVERPPKRKN